MPSSAERKAFTERHRPPVPLVCNDDLEAYLDDVYDEETVLVGVEAYLDEHRVVDEETGGEKGSKLARFDLLPEDVLWVVAEHFGKGAIKYEDRNWEKGYAWSLSYAACRRHLAAWWTGEDTEVDDFFGPYSHLDAALFHLMAMRAFELRSMGTDDRQEAAHPWNPHSTPSS